MGLHYCLSYQIRISKVERWSVARFVYCFISQLFHLRKGYNWVASAPDELNSNSVDKTNLEILGD